MYTPKVKFSNFSLNDEVNLIYWFLFQHSWGWSKSIIKKHPKLKDVLLIKKEIERRKYLRKYIFNFRKENKKIIEKNKIWYQKEWLKVEKDYFILLSEIIQVKWPKRKKVIKAMLSINPICPRFLDEWSFTLYYNYNKISPIKEVTMHETCHFLYFEKWRELYPKMSRKKYDSPHIEWHLSEIVAPIILNDKRVQKLLKKKAHFYREHQRLKLNGKTVPRFFTDLYNKRINEEDGFEKFIKEAYMNIKRNKKLFDF